ncbi:MAG: flippase-like domain-containing protein [Oscillospiraceae bacterium]|nr:flippase-like domain-containing protein [Oscillospiraceae bacterium]
MQKKKKIIWALVALVLMVLTFRTVLRMGEQLSLRSLLQLLSHANRGWLILSVLSMLCFIFFEGEALLLILRVFGWRKGLADGILYSAGDIYFSSITPSASGGQPASAFFMLRGGIPGAVVTVTLLVNLMAYTMATLGVGAAALVLRPRLFLAMSRPAKALVLLGFVLLVVLTAVFLGLLRHGEGLFRAGAWGLLLLARLHLVRDRDAALAKLRGMVDQYEQCAGMLRGKGLPMLGVLLLDMAQRIAQVSVTPLVHLALEREGADPLSVWAASTFAQIGSNCMPVPGGMGIADYLLYQGFSPLMDRVSALQLGLISRSVTFYLCMFLSGAVTLLGFLLVRRRKMGK